MAETTAETAVTVALFLLTALMMMACSPTGDATIDNVEVLDSASEETADDNAEAADDDAGAADGNAETVDMEDSTPTPEPTDVPVPAEPTVEPRFELVGDLALDTADVNGLVEFVEAEAGRPFQWPPTIKAESLEDFEEGLQPTDEDLAKLDEHFDSTARYLQVMDLTDQGSAELRDLYVEVLSSADGVAGYYDPETDAVHLPNAPTDDSPGADDQFRALLVHELTHALDAQYEDFVGLIDHLEAMEAAGDLEAALAIASVVEGRATSVQFRWMMANNVAPPAPTDEDLGRAADLPPAILMQISLPYGVGAEFIEANGGAAMTWDLYDNPPTTSEQVMFPDTPLDEPVIDVATPLADGPILEDSVFGSGDLFIWQLGESLQPDPAVIYPTLAAADGWAGGQAVLWGDQTESCVRATLVADSELDLDELDTMITRWANDAPNRDVIRSADQVEFTSCAPYLP